MPIRGRHPSAVVNVGDTVHMPGYGPVDVGSVSRKYFTGTNAEGVKVGKTGVGLIAGARMGKPSQPWQVDKKETPT